MAFVSVLRKVQLARDSAESPTLGDGNGRDGGLALIGRDALRLTGATAEPKSFDDFDLRLGDLMRGERATLGKSLLDVQRELKIKASYIAAIENADPTAFETQGFIAGYVRSYARYLGMDPEWAYAKFCEEGSFATSHGMSAAASTAQRKELPVRQGKVDALANPATPFSPRQPGVISKIEPGALGSVAVLIGLIAVLGYGGWYLLREVQRVQFAPIEQAPIVASEMGEGGVVEPTLTLPGNDVSGALANSPYGRTFQPNPLDVPVLVPRDGPISTINPNQTGALADVTSATLLPAESDAATATDAAVAEALGLEGTPLPQVFEATPDQVVLVAVRPSWIQVASADGTVLYEQILDKGDTYVVPLFEEPAMLRSGNGGGIYIQTAEALLGPVGTHGEVVKNIPMAMASLTETYISADPASDDDLADVISLAQNNAGQ
jgi:hypothetical protein